MRVTFPSALLLLFVGLKLGHVIEWSWLWVLSPLWIPLAIGCACILVAGICSAALKALG